MADHVYKPSEVPKGQRWQYFKDYYLRSTIVLIIIVSLLVSLLYTTVFAPRPDVYLFASHTKPLDLTFWNEVKSAVESMPIDYNRDKHALVDMNYIHFDLSLEKKDPEAYAATQNKLMLSLATAEYALQIVDEDLFATLTEMELIGTYAELPDAMGHNPEEIIKIPLQELTPFKNLPGLPDGLYMTLRPKDAMQIGESKKKLLLYENQVKTLLSMMQ